MAELLSNCWAGDECDECGSELLGLEAEKLEVFKVLRVSKSCDVLYVFNSNKGYTYT